MPMPTKTVIELTDDCYQDGGIFYAETIRDNDPIPYHVELVDYSYLVKDDYDLEGAAKARELFAQHFPQYCVMTEVEVEDGKGE